MAIYYPMQIADFEWLGILLLVISVVILAIGGYLLMKGTTKIRAGIDISADTGETVGPVTIYNITTRINFAGHGSLTNPALYLSAKSPDEKMDAVWDQQTIRLGKIQAGTSRMIETKITIPAGCDVLIKGILSPESTTKSGERYTIESTEIIVRADSWKENKN